jgi:hypothetical protein
MADLSSFAGTQLAGGGIGVGARSERKESTMVRIARVALVTLVAVGAGCSYHRAFISYDAVAWKLPLSADLVVGERLGVVRASEGGALWRECTDVARGSVWVLIADAREMGGNAIGDIRWFPSKPDLDHRTPVCKKKWGWFLIWPVLLTPGFQSAIVEATAYRVAEPQTTRSGLYVIPDRPDEQRALVDRIIAETTSGSACSP